MKLIETIKGKKFSIPPIWFMRQAGRYLPEYNIIKHKAGSFLNLCKNPILAKEVTLQPLKRFDLDAAIIFSDILLIPNALGYNLRFLPDHGPILDKITINNYFNYDKDKIFNQFNHTYEAINLTRSFLNKEKALIGFAGAPWTVALYMLSGKPPSDKSQIRKIIYNNFTFVNKLITDLTDITITHLCNQYKAGADCVMIFDSWAGILPPFLLKKLSVDPINLITKKLKEFNIPTIIFPRSIGDNLDLYENNNNTIATDFLTTDKHLLKLCKKKIVVQTGPDPMALLGEEKYLNRQIDHIMETLHNFPYIMNLSHGINKETNPNAISKMIDYIKAK